MSVVSCFISFVMSTKYYANVIFTLRYQIEEGESVWEHLEIGLSQVGGDLGSDLAN